MNYKLEVVAVKKPKDPGTFGKYTTFNDYFGLALSFGITMLVTLAIMMWLGNRLDDLLGTDQICWLVFTILGIFSGFHVFIDQVDMMQNPPDVNDRDWDLQNKPKQTELKKKRK